MPAPSEPLVRPFEPRDATPWVRCRVLSFLDSAYFDEVRTEPTRFSGPAVRLVAIVDDELVGLIDIETAGRLATIDSIAVHPDHQGSGIARRLLASATNVLPPDVAELDAWTRDDVAANAWYRANGFAEEQHYLHVFKTWDEPGDDHIPGPVGLSVVGAFMHASIDREAELRARFRRVHICRRYVRAVR